MSVMTSPLNYSRIASLVPGKRFLHINGNCIVTANSGIRECKVTMREPLLLMPLNHCFLTMTERGLKFLKEKSQQRYLDNTNNASIEIQGGFENNGTFKLWDWNLQFYHKLQSIDGTNALTFSSLQINTPGTISLLTNNITVSNLLTMTLGNINTGSYKVIIEQKYFRSPCLTSGKIIGKLQRAIGVNRQLNTFIRWERLQIIIPAKINFNNLNPGSLTLEYICGRSRKRWVTGR